MLHPKGKWVWPQAALPLVCMESPLPAKNACVPTRLALPRRELRRGPGGLGLPPSCDRCASWWRRIRSSCSWALIRVRCGVEGTGTLTCGRAQGDGHQGISVLQGTQASGFPAPPQV